MLHTHSPATFFFFSFLLQNFISHGGYFLSPSFSLFLFLCQFFFLSFSFMTFCYFPPVFRYDFFLIQFSLNVQVICTLMLWNLDAICLHHPYQLRILQYKHKAFLIVLFCSVVVDFSFKIKYVNFSWGAHLKTEANCDDVERFLTLLPLIQHKPSVCTQTHNNFWVAG